MTVREMECKGVKLAPPSRTKCTTGCYKIRPYTDQAITISPYRKSQFVMKEILAEWQLRPGKCLKRLTKNHGDPQ